MSRIQDWIIQIVITVVNMELALKANAFVMKVLLEQAVKI